MSKNICPCCHGHSDYLDMPEQTSTFLCTGCEIKLYFPLHEIMEKRNVNKEVAYKILSRNKTCKQMKLRFTCKYVFHQKVGEGYESNKEIRRTVSKSI